MPLDVGSHVYAKPPPHHRGDQWTYGKVVRSAGSRSYTIQTRTGIELRRNRVHLRPAAAPTVPDAPRYEIPMPIPMVWHQPIALPMELQRTHRVSHNRQKKWRPPVHVQRSVLMRVTTNMSVLIVPEPAVPWSQETYWTYKTLRHIGKMHSPIS